MLPNRKRLKKNNDIRAALRTRQYESRTPLLQIIAKENNCKNPRVAVVIKGIKSSVTRNRLKRLTRAAIGDIIDKISKNVDMVIFPKERLLEEKSYNIAKKVIELVKKWPE